MPYHVTKKNIDILCFHKNIKYTGFPLRYKYSVIELKRDKAKSKDISQLINYSKWVAGRLANSEIETIQPILISYELARDSITKAKNSDFVDNLLLVKYEIKQANIFFKKLSY